MKEIRLAYPNIQNAGDILNISLLNNLFGLDVIRRKVYDADMLAIGGALSGLQYAKTKSRYLKQYIAGRFYSKRTLHIWGTGFLHEDNDNCFYRKNINICALRGELSRKKVEKILRISISVPLADPGLLASALLHEKCTKENSVGIIPHYSQQGEEVFSRLIAAFPKALLIDIRKMPLDVIRDIAKCEYILSSSLHGLIFADSLGIPSLHVIGEKRLSGNNFKFNDYYSSYGLVDPAWNLNKSIPQINDIIDNYKICIDDVELKKQQLIDVFPRI